MSSNGVVVIVDGSSSIAASRGSSASCPPSTAAATGQKILQQRWVCDVCKVKWFLDFREACEHEESCGKVGNARNGGGGLSPPPPPPPSSSSCASFKSTIVASRVVQSDSISSADSNDDSAKSESDGDDIGKGMVDDGRRLRRESKRSRATPAASSPSCRGKEGANISTKNSSRELLLRDESSSVSSSQEDLKLISRKKKKAKTKEKENPKGRETRQTIGGGGGGGGGQPLASIFLPKTGVRAAPPRGVVDVVTIKKQTEKSSRKTKKTVNSKVEKKEVSLSRKADTSKDDEVVPPVLFPGVSRAEYDEHIVAERQHQETAAARHEQQQKQPIRISKRLRALTEESTDDDEEEPAKKPNKRSRLSRRRVERQKNLDDDDDDCIGNDSSSSKNDEDDDDVDYVATNSNVAAVAITATARQKKSFLSKKQLAEHHAAEIFARRKREASEERERQKKREELRQIRRPNKSGEMEEEEEEELIAKDVDIAAAAAGEVDGRNSMSTLHKGGDLTQCPPRFMDKRTPYQISSFAQDVKKEMCIPAVRFPCPSHVVPSNGTDDDESLDMETEESINCSSSLRQVRKTPMYQHLKPDLVPSTCTEESFVQHPPGLGADDTHARNIMFDLLSSVFDQVENETNTKEEEDASKQSVEDKNQLWVDGYSMKSIPDDFLGTDNKEASKKFISFVEEWKLRRHKSVQRMGRAKLKGRRKKKKHGYDSDDSFLDDGYAGLENVFLITGPTGSGKTRLVHAVAEQSDCVVIEINTSEQRSGAALKRAIQETTQSHSSLAVSRKKQQHGKGTGDLFGSNAIGIENNYNEDMEIDEHSDICFDSDEESAKESHSLTIILIDEVDLMFEEDTGFWLALTQVSQKAKCPIVLTANSTPPELSNFRCQSICLKRPPRQECAIKMAYIAKSKGMRFNHDVKLDERLDRLSLIAEVCKCDMRKILNEMQLFNFAESRRHSRTARLNTNTFGLQLNRGCSTSQSSVNDRPLILNMEPKLIPKDRHTLIRITGKNFSSVAFPGQHGKAGSTNLFIGGNECSHYRIVSATEICAIFQPCVIPKGVSEKAIYQDDFAKNIDCLTCKFLEVAVCKKCANGLVLHSSSLLGLENDGSPASKKWNIEYDIPLRDDAWREHVSREDLIRKLKSRKEAQGNAANKKGALVFSDEEEFEKEPAPPESNVQVQCNEVGEPSLEIECEREDFDPQAMLDAAIAGMEALEETSMLRLSSDVDLVSLVEFNHFADEVGLLSDAIMLEDAFSTLAIPSLAGSVEGFGSDALESASATVSSIPKLCKGKNKKPPSFEALYSSGMNESGFFFGNTNSYVTHPIMRRDRQLLSYSELHSRGLGFLDNSGCSFEENSFDNSKSGMDDEETESPFLQLQACARLEDDSLLNPQVSQSFLSLPSLLKQGLGVTRNHGLTMDPTPLLRSRKSQIATNALGVMHSAVANCDLWYTGLRHDDSDEAAQKIWRRDSILDHPLSLDYLPHLRAIAHHERRIRRKVEDMMTENGDASRGGRRTRTSRKNIRRHYLDECAGGQDKTIEGKALELAEKYMIVE